MNETAQHDFNNLVKSAQKLIAVDHTLGSIANTGMSGQAISGTREIIIDVASVITDIATRHLSSPEMIDNKSKIKEP